MSIAERRIRVVIDPTGAVAGANAVNNALRRIGGANGPLNAVNDNSRAATRSLNGLAGSATRAALGIAGLGLAVGGIAALATAITGTSDKMAELEARMLNATGSQAAMAAGMSSVVQIANQTRNGIAEVGALYTKMAQNAGNLGITLDQAGVATRTFAMALKVGGASAQEAQSSILQLSQAMASGVLQGDEFKSLAENSPVFMQLLADSMGVPLGTLKALGSEGKITGEQIAKALTDPKLIADIEKRFGRIPVTFADIRTSVGNSAMQMAASLAKGLDFQDSLAVGLAKFNEWTASILPTVQAFGAQLREAFSTIAPVVSTLAGIAGTALNLILANLGNITKAALSVGAAFVTMKAGMALGAAVSSVKLLYQQMMLLGGLAGATTKSMALYSGAMTIARNATNAFTASLLANPFTAIATALVLIGSLLYQFSDQIQIGTDGVGTLADLAAVVWEDMSAGLKALGDIMSSVWSGIKDTVSGVFDGIKSAFGGVVEFFQPALDMISGAFSSVFGGISFSLMGLVKLFARSADFWISAFTFAGKTIGAIFNNFPRLVGAGIRSAANLVITGIEWMVNKAVDGINLLIAGINKIPGVSVGTLGPVALGRVQGEGLGAALSDTMPSWENNHAIEGRVDSWGDRADKRAEERNRKAAEEAGSPDGGRSPAADAAGGKEGKDKKSKAKELEDAVKKYQEFLDKMRDELEQAKLLRHEAELRAKQEEAKKILGAQYGEIQAQEIANLVEQTRLAKALTGMRQQAFELANETTLLEKALGESDKTRQKFAEELLKAQLEYLNNGGDIAQLSSEDWKLQEAALITELQRNDALKERLRLRTEEFDLGKRLFAEAGVTNDPAAKARYERDTALKALGTVSKPEGMSQSDFERQMREANKRIVDEYEEKMLDIANKFNDEMVGAIYQIGDALGGVLGKAINGIADAIDNLNQMQQGDYSGSGLLGGIARLGSTLSKDFGTSIDKGLDGFSKEGLQKAFADPMSSMSSSFSKFTSSFSGPNGLVKGLGNAVGGAMAGAAMGTAVAGVGKMFWSKFSTTGAQVGGALGSIAGPIGSAIGSVLGGTIGGLFKKSKQGGAGLELSDGRLTAGSGFGNSKGMTANGMAAAGEVANGINAIADALGATITGAGGITVGQYNDKWRVSTTGATSFKGQSKSEAANERNQGLYNFGEDGQAAAIAFAVSEALKKGILTGISEFSKRVIQAQGEAGVNLASQYEKLLKELRFMSDPLSSGAQQITQSLDDLAKAMQKSGATAAELGKVEEYRQRKLEQYIDDQLSSLRDFRKELQGEAGGFTSLSLLTRDLADFEAMRRDITAGKTVDQDAFLSLASDINSNAGSIYGSSSAYVDIRNMVADATDGLINNISAEIDDATVNAIHEQTKNITGQQGITNDLLHQINEQLKSNAAQGARGGTGSGGGRSFAVNGKIVNHF